MSNQPFNSSGNIRRSPELIAVETKLNNYYTSSHQYPTVKKPSPPKRYGISKEMMTPDNWETLSRWVRMNYSSPVTPEALELAFDTVPRRYAGKLKDFGYYLRPKAMRQALRFAADLKAGVR